MSHIHDSHNDHNHDHGGHGLNLERMDQSQRSMADALQLSFRLLSVIMVLVLAGLIMTGVSQINSGSEVGVRVQFGRIVGEGENRLVREGLTWSLPEPLGRVIKVDTNIREITIDNFWFAVAPENVTKSLTELQGIMGQNKGLQPGVDGALFTADQALGHVKFKCKYNVISKGGRTDADAVINYLSHVQDANQLVRTAVCNAAIRVAAKTTVDSIITPTGDTDFIRPVWEQTQRLLDGQQSGLEITFLGVDEKTAPLAARAAFEKVLQARQNSESTQKQAGQDALSLLSSVAGQSSGELVDPKDPEKGLIGEYSKARQEGRAADAEKLVARIDALLTSPQTTGEVAGIISEAQTYRSQVKQRMEGRLRAFDQLLANYNSTPEVTMNYLWQSVRAELFGPTAEVYYLPAGQKVTLRINQDPEVHRNIQKAMTAAVQDKNRRP